MIPGQTQLWLSALGGKFEPQFPPSKTNKQTNNSTSKNSSQISKVEVNPESLDLLVLAEGCTGNQNASLSPSDFPEGVRVTPALHPHITQIQDQAYLSLPEVNSLQNSGLSRMHSATRTENARQNGLIIKEMYFLMCLEIQRHWGGSLSHAFNCK